MSDTDEKPAASGAAVPSWQRGTKEESRPNDNRAETSSQSDYDPLEIARLFLDDENVRDAPREKKIEFLKAKGISETDIQTLLEEENKGSSSSSSSSSSQVCRIFAKAYTARSIASLANNLKQSDTQVVQTKEKQQQLQPQPPQSSPPPRPDSPPPAYSSHTHDRPPIVTYPEFLTQPERPPPLVTTSRLLNTIYSFAGLSTFLYGTSKFVVAPMVEAQTEARHDFHTTTSDRLAALISKLEDTVSVVPAPPRRSTDFDAFSEAEDPSEMFHRDMGTQTSAPFLSARDDGNDNAATNHQAKGLARLNKDLTELRDEFRSESDDMETIKTAIDVLQDDLDTLTFGGNNSFSSGYDIYGKARKAEPEDEIRKARDNIRRVKGVLLSTRNFPSSTR